MGIVRNQPTGTSGPVVEPEVRNDKITLAGSGVVGTDIVASYPPDTYGGITFVRISLTAPFEAETIFGVTSTNSVPYTVEAGDIGYRIAARVSNVSYIDPVATITAKPVAAKRASRAKAKPVEDPQE